MPDATFLRVPENGWLTQDHTGALGVADATARLGIIARSETPLYQIHRHAAFATRAMTALRAGKGNGCAAVEDADGRGAVTCERSDGRIFTLGTYRTTDDARAALAADPKAFAAKQARITNMMAKGQEIADLLKKGLAAHYKDDER